MARTIVDSYIFENIIELITGSINKNASWQNKECHRDTIEIPRIGPFFNMARGVSDSY